MPESLYIDDGWSVSCEDTQKSLHIEHDYNIDTVRMSEENHKYLSYILKNGNFRKLLKHRDCSDITFAKFKNDIDHIIANPKNIIGIKNFV